MEFRNDRARQLVASIDSHADTFAAFVRHLGRDDARELSIALVKIEEAAMWARKYIMRVQQ